MVWNPALEARPEHICRQYGDNRGAEVHHIVLSPTLQAVRGTATGSVRALADTQFDAPKSLSHYPPAEGTTRESGAS
eukprot:3676139-Karenia_brevis.AAC.1